MFFRRLVILGILSSGAWGAKVSAQLCHVSTTELMTDGLKSTSSSTDMREFDAPSARGGACAEKMKDFVDELVQHCPTRHYVRAEIRFTVGPEKFVEAEWATPCGKKSRRAPASEESQHVNRYMDEVYNQIQTDYDRHPLTGLKLKSPRPRASLSEIERLTNAARGPGAAENIHAGKRRWLENRSRPESPTSPDEAVERGVKDRQMATADSRTLTGEQNAYIQEFIRNAQADGWSIRVKAGQIQVLGRTH